VKTWATLIILLIVVADASDADARQSAFRVSTFGAVGDGVHDDGAAICNTQNTAICVYTRTRNQAAEMTRGVQDRRL